VSTARYGLKRLDIIQVILGPSKVSFICTMNCFILIRWFLPTKFEAFAVTATWTV
jgi:hypothetical protein